MSQILNLNIDQGTTFTQDIVYRDNSKNPVNISGYEVRGKLRRSYYSANSISLTCSITNAANGAVTISLPSETTSNLVYGRYLYDVEIFNGNVVYRISQGIVTIDPEVTR